MNADSLEISLDPARLDLDAIHAFLAGESHWARGIPRATVARSIAHSLCVGAYAEGRQIGFARVVTDRATFGFLCDVFVLPAWRGRGVSHAMLRALFAHPDLQGLRRMALTSRDAGALYTRHDFTPLARPEIWMERHNPVVYAAAAAPQTNLEQA